MLSRIALTIAASILTTTGITIAVTAGIERGTGYVDRFIYVSLAVGASLITQFLPTRKGGWKKWILLSVAACVTMLAHMSFFATSTKMAGELRATKSEAVTRVTKRIADVTAERNSIVSRPVTVVTAEFSHEHNYRKRAALTSELSEANRKIKLSELIDSLNGDLVTTYVTNTADAVTNLVTDVPGVTASRVTLIYSFAFFVLIEMSAAYLWSDLLQKGDNTKAIGQMDGESVVDAKSESGVKAIFAVKRLSMQFKPATLNVPVLAPTVPEPPVIDAVKHEGVVATAEISKRDRLLLKLMQDVREGNCGTTARAIRQHLRCNMKLAGELTRKVKELMKAPEIMH